MQLKYSFKKEKMQFFRTFRFLAVVIVMFSFALGNPLMFKFTSTMLDMMAPELSESDTLTSGESKLEQSKPENVTDIFGVILSETAAAVDSDAVEGFTVKAPSNPEDPMDSLNAMLGEMGMNDMLDLYKDAGIMFSTTITTFAAGPILVIMLLLMSAAGGEQKKRAMIVPMCSGLQYKSYLLPKFVIYPTTVFATTFAAAVVSGLLCNMMFENNKVTVGIILLSSLLIAIYNSFIISVYLSLGLCTSKPGVMAALLYVGQMILQTLLSGIGLRDYHPFALLNYVGGEMVMEDFSLAEKAPAIIVSAAISIVISVLMYFLALGVLGAKKTDNQAEKEPEF